VRAHLEVAGVLTLYTEPNGSKGRNAAFVKALDDVEVALQALCAAAAFTSHHKIFIIKGNETALTFVSYFLNLTHQNSHNVKFIFKLYKVDLMGFD
jgi:hypothetical protein